MSWSTRGKGWADRVAGGSRQGFPPPVRRDGPGDPPPLLRDAARRAAAVSAKRLGDGAPVETISELLVKLVMAVVRGGTPSQSHPELRSELGRTLLDDLRSQIIKGWGEGPETPPAAELLRTLEALEAVREAIEPDWLRDFGSQLSGPDGLTLVVEVAHDLRSPLTSILFLAELLMNGQSGEVNDLQRRQLGLVYSAALGLSEVSSNLIELARGGDRLAENEPTPFSLRATLESVLDITRPMAEEKGLTIRLDSPKADQRLGYPIALNRVLLNLTTNAIKFTEAGFVELVARDTGPTTVEFSVRDTGRGMGADALETLFAPFRRVPGEDRYTFSGTGLGLSLCRRLITAMCSELKVESKQGWGTRFHFEVEFPVDERALHGLQEADRAGSSATNVDMAHR